MRRTAAHGPKITAIRTYWLQLPLPETFSTPQTRLLGRDVLLIEIVTEGNVSGWGECAGPPILLQSIVHDFLAPTLLGQDAMQTDRLWYTLWQESSYWGRRGIVVSAISGLDMALWDARGHILKQSCSEMMGGRCYDRIPCFATGLLFRDRPEVELIPALLEEARYYIDQGFRGIKAQIGRNLTFDLTLVRRLRETFPVTPLMADASHAYDLPDALNLGRALEESNYLWFEDPLGLEFPAQYRELAERLRIPLATGEWEQTRWGFQSLLTASYPSSRNGINVLLLNLAYCGGPSEALQIRAIATAHGLNVVPVGSGTILNFAASLHFLASTQRLPPRLETTPSPLGWNIALNPLRDLLHEGPPCLEGGLATVPVAPGWGVTIVREKIRQFCTSEREQTL